MRPPPSFSADARRRPGFRAWPAALLGLGAAAGSLGGCGDGSAALRVGPVRYTEEELVGLSPQRRGRLAEMTAFGLAVASGEMDSLSAPLLDGLERRLLVEQLAAHLQTRAAGVTDAVLEARYLTDPAYELEVRHIIFLSERWRPEAERAGAREKAERALRRLREGASFPELAAELSEEPGAEGRQGLLQPGREGSWVPEFWRAASALDVGEISGVVETQYGFHVLRLESRRVVPFAEARAGVVREVAAMLPGEPGEALRAWTDSAAPEVALRGDGVGAWAAGTAADTAVVAGWEGGRYTAGELERDLAGTPASVPAPATDPGELVRRLARLRMLAGQARAMGVEVPPSVRGEERRDWEDRTARWAAALGFEEGLAPDAVAERALGALATTGQSASIAREEMGGYGRLLRRAYPVEGLEETAPPQSP